MQNPGLSVFPRPLFTGALLLLLLNDHYLKYAFPGFLTGKLSDVAGLFVFHLFLLHFFPAQPKKITAFVVLFFISWKSPFSQPVIDLFNSIQPFTLHRTIDYTDLLALPVLWCSWKMFYNSPVFTFRFVPAFKVMVMAVSVYSFFATTIIMKPVMVSSKNRVKHVPSEIITQLSNAGYEFTIDTTRTGAKYEYYQVNVKDTLNISCRLPAYRFILYPIRKRKTEMEISVAYWEDSKDSVNFDKKKTKKELHHWLKQFE
ncbi:MAG: hypothetical protein ACOZCO_00880 [Bacteroidota bacterium]